MNIEEALQKYQPENAQEIGDYEQYHKLIREETQLLTRANIDYHFSVSAWIVNVAKEKVLLAYHKQYQSFTWLGGHLDGNPNALDVIYQEIIEESGLCKVHLLQKDIFSFEILNVKAHQKKRSAGAITQAYQCDLCV